MPADASMRCPVCGGGLRIGLQPWHRSCPECSLECSTLTPSINENDGNVAKEEFCGSLASLRRRNFILLCDQLAAMTPLRGKHLLEVGCALGWFLDEAQQRSLECLGIEADVTLGAHARKLGHQVLEGFFPECLNAAGVRGQKFDLIVFNDVFEHLPDMNQAMAVCRDYLAQGGLLVINLPATTGFLYRVSKLLCYMGRPASFERMWQKGFPSPHLAYFNARTLGQLAHKYGLHRQKSFTLPSVAYRGLWQRIGIDRRISLLSRLASFLALAALVPALALLPHDIEVHVFGPAG